MSCIYQDRFTDGGLFLCRKFLSWCTSDRCELCPHFAAGVALPIPAESAGVTEELQPEVSCKCIHEGEIVFDEPCECGASSRIAIHACHSSDRIRRSQTRAWCVPLLLNWDRLADPMARTSFRCCESCEFRQLSDAPVSRHEPEDPHEPN